MRRILGGLAFAILGSITACASKSEATSDYNRGVFAYRAKDYAKARNFWASAVNTGDKDSMNNLGYLLYYGLGGDADATQAVALWRQASALGEDEAQFHLGVALHEGKGVDRDDVEAYALLRCAAASAQARAEAGTAMEETIAAEARKSLDALLGEISKDQFEAGEMRAQQCMPAKDHVERPVPFNT